MSILFLLTVRCVHPSWNGSFFRFLHWADHIVNKAWQRESFGNHSSQTASRWHFCDGFWLIPFLSSCLQSFGIQHYPHRWSFGVFGFWNRILNDFLWPTHPAVYTIKSVLEPLVGEFWFLCLFCQLPLQCLPGLYFGVEVWYIWLTSRERGGSVLFTFSPAPVVMPGTQIWLTSLSILSFSFEFFSILSSHSKVQTRTDVSVSVRPARNWYDAICWTINEKV